MPVDGTSSNCRKFQQPKLAAAHGCSHALPLDHTKATILFHLFTSERHDLPLLAAVSGVRAAGTEMSRHEFYKNCWMKAMTKGVLSVLDGQHASSVFASNPEVIQEGVVWGVGAWLWRPKHVAAIFMCILMCSLNSQRCTCWWVNCTYTKMHGATVIKDSTSYLNFIKTDINSNYNFGGICTNSLPFPTSELAGWLAGRWNFSARLS